MVGISKYILAFLAASFLLTSCYTKLALIEVTSFESRESQPAVVVIPTYPLIPTDSGNQPERPGGIITTPHPDKPRPFPAGGTIKPGKQESKRISGGNRRPVKSKITTENSSNSPKKHRRHRL